MEDGGWRMQRICHLYGSQELGDIRLVPRRGGSLAKAEGKPEVQLINFLLLNSIKGFQQHDYIVFVDVFCWQDFS